MVSHFHSEAGFFFTDRQKLFGTLWVNKVNDNIGSYNFGEDAEVRLGHLGALPS